MERPKAFITGITGQDGSYLAELLLSYGYEVHGLIRRTSIPHLQYLKPILDKITLHEGDMADHGSLHNLIKKILPDEVYNFGAMAGVTPSFYQPEYSIHSCGLSVVTLLEAIRQNKPDTKFFQAGSSHIFGNTPTSPQTEETPFSPISPYGCGKALGQHLLRHYRESYGIYACSAISYAHASPRYSEGFLLSKIVAYLRNPQGKLELGNLDVPMDIGYAKDFVEAYYNIMQQDKPDDFIISTGETHSPKEYLELAFKEFGMKMEDHVVINDKLKRVSEVSVLTGDYSKANKAFGYKPKTSFNKLVKIMCNEKAN